ncbi:MAG: MFS transporter [Thermomicrobiales bacterium]|nr:MAG: MFS transporter [Thermomicrobiales bacterium]
MVRRTHVQPSDSASGPAARIPRAPFFDRVTAPFPISLAMTVLTYWTIDIISPALPAIQQSLMLTAAGASLVWSLLFAGRLLGNIPAAMLVDRVGPPLTAACGAALLALGSLLAAVTGDFPTLYPGRVVQGLGIALLVNAGLRALVRIKPSQGAALTYFGFAATLGGVFGLQSGGFLTGSLGWRAVFVLSTALSVILLVLALAGSHGSRDSHATRTRRDAESPPAGPTRWATLALPVMLNLIVYVNYSLFVALPLYAQREFGASPETNANLLFVITVVHLLVSFPVGRAIQRWGSNRLAAGGLILAAAGMLLVLPAPHPFWTVPALILYGTGQVAAGNASGDLVLQRGGRSGKAVGLVRLSGDLGLVVGPYLTGALADWRGYHTPFLALPLLTAFGFLSVIAVSLSAQRRSPVDQRSPAL